MNKEILFRGKRIDNGEWVKGYMVENTYREYRCFIIASVCWEIENDRNVDLIETDVYEVDPSTLCQYTGLTDKNGKKIWQEDIVCSHKNKRSLAKVTYSEFGVIDAKTLGIIDTVIGWHYEVIPTDALSKCEPFCLPMPLTDMYINRCEFEVIGNIFDDQELLEVEHE